MTRKERQELKAIAMWLRTLRVRIPTDLGPAMIHASFFEWALSVLEGREPKGRRTPDYAEVKDHFSTRVKEFKTAQAKLVAEGQKPTSTAIFERMAESHKPIISADSLRKQLARDLAKLGKGPDFIKQTDQSIADTVAKIEAEKKRRYNEGLEAFKEEASAVLAAVLAESAGPVALEEFKEAVEALAESSEGPTAAATFQKATEVLEEITKAAGALAEFKEAAAALPEDEEVESPFDAMGREIFGTEPEPKKVV